MTTYGEYEDFINYKPLPIKKITPEQFTEAIEYNKILSALSEKILTVKEIHDLYLDKSKKHTKTLKTIYRHMESLEKSNIVIVVGHRKYAKKRTPEKLYGRVANIFVQEDDSNNNWIESEEGRIFLQKVTDTLATIWGNEKTDREQVRKTLLEYYNENKTHEKYLFKQISSNPEIQDIFQSVKIDTVKSILKFLNPLMVLLSDKELQQRLQRELSN